MTDTTDTDAALIDALETMRGRMDIETLLAALPRLLELARECLKWRALVAELTPSEQHDEQEAHGDH